MPKCSQRFSKLLIRIAPGYDRDDGLLGWVAAQCDLRREPCTATLASRQRETCQALEERAFAG